MVPVTVVNASVTQDTREMIVCVRISCVQRTVPTLVYVHAVVNAIVHQVMKVISVSVTETWAAPTTV